ncbi:glycosyltransferase [Amylibacter sp.]|nr:glycosyltransferase [Amylibacter sp.]
MIVGGKVLWFSAFILGYIWIGYLLCLKVLSSKLIRRQSQFCEISYPEVTIIVAAHNEAQIIRQRIENLFDTDYPLNLLSVVVASDGSTDNTLGVARSLNDSWDVVALEVQPQSGRAGAHNFAVDHLHTNNSFNGLLVFTDAETTFNRNTLPELVKPFVNTKIGYVAGLLKYSNQNSSDITQSVGVYWRFEHILRRLETDLGIFAFGTGAVCAVRSELYQDIPPTGDVDFTTPLDVILQGFKCVQSQSALAWDKMPETRQQEFRARVRMTAKNLYGTITRWGLTGHFRHPLYSWVIWSHKIGRWLTPFFMLAIFITTLSTLTNKYSLILLLIQLVFYTTGLVYGLIGRGGQIPRAIFSFLLANAGFFIGVIKVLTGKVPSLYRPISQTKHDN